MDWTFLPVTLAAILAAALAVRWLSPIRRVETVHPWEALLVYRDGRFERTLTSGRHVFLDPWRRLTLVRVPTGDRTTRFGAIDVLSADRFAFRITLSVVYRPRDHRAAYEATASTVPAGDQPRLFEELAASATSTIAARPLDDAIVQMDAIGDQIAAALVTRLPNIEVVAVTPVKLDLPPELRKMLTEVERARRTGLAALERARGEHAALRSLANAARLVRDNPELERLRLLQTIETARGPTTIVLGDTGAGSEPRTRAG